ncbi:hypothetical protein AXA84_0114 [Candidatus Phytoplasma oryzae]|uniref:Uncharacterized protein n=1 Tax=Candidatus Phytoplasma oryzae TaxID=203274 RepID=A0A139JR85_9MOLU|nr:hypothetical protein [Candidatus Phytoplasma oryzae]KXT29468.1 hypothetical protein AXA84_0114 [Candidatus Phytoplasma oryzae]RAM58046.1 hypothetical protein DH96_00645 [Candidatus Phytoplasma oryzae]
MFLKSFFKKKWIFIVLIMFLFLVLSKIFQNKKKFIEEINFSSSIPAPKMKEIKILGKEKWKNIHKEYIFYGLNGFYYYKKELQKEKNKPIRNQNSSLISFYQHKIEMQKEPKDILGFLQKTFKEWGNTEIGVPAFDDITFIKSEKSVLYPFIENFKVNNDSVSLTKDNYYLTFTFKGPKYLLAKDVDFFLGNANLPYYDRDTNIILTKKYYLHFNPVRNILSVYTEKFNYNKYYF